LASGVYLLNDLSDRERDREHPTKKHRPIASGAVSVRAARLGIVSLWGGAALCSLWLGGWFFVPAASYAVINLLYSAGLRSIPFVDVGVIALGFLLRVLAGSAAAEVPLSHWIILDTFFLAFFMGLGKRYQELLTLGVMARSSLRGYSLVRIWWGMLITGAAAWLCYGLYAASPSTQASFGSWLILATVPFPGLGIWRFLRLARMPGRSPTEAILRDPLFLGIVLAWGALILYLVF
jgi:4-hydroxybenzoate polyprenyltransferase